VVVEAGLKMNECSWKATFVLATFTQKLFHSMSQLHPEVIASQLASYSFSLYRCLDSEDLRNNNFSKKVDPTPGPEKKKNTVVQMIDAFNILSRIISQELIMPETVKARASALALWTGVLKVLSAPPLCDLNSSVAILTGMCNSSCYRMRGTQELFEKNYHSLSVDLANLMMLTDFASGHQSYRRYQATQTQCIPFLGISLTDLVFILDGNVPGPHRDNLERNAINALLAHQSHPPVVDNIYSLPFLQRVLPTQENFIATKKATTSVKEKETEEKEEKEEKEEDGKKVLLTDNQLWYLSLSREPRKPS